MEEKGFISAPLIMLFSAFLNEKHIFILRQTLQIRSRVGRTFPCSVLQPGLRGSAPTGASATPPPRAFLMLLCWPQAVVPGAVLPTDTLLSSATAGWSSWAPALWSQVHTFVCVCRVGEDMPSPWPALGQAPHAAETALSRS